MFEKSLAIEVTEEYNALSKLESFLDTIEVKDVDLERAIDKWIDDAAITHEDCSITDVISTAKHFFELGMQQLKNNNNDEEKK